LQTQLRASIIISTTQYTRQHAINAAQVLRARAGTYVQRTHIAQTVTNALHYPYTACTCTCIPSIKGSARAFRLPHGHAGAWYAHISIILAHVAEIPQGNGV